MAVTKEDLGDFIRFADEKLENGCAISLMELAGEWEAQHRERERVAGTCPIKVDPATISELAKAFPDVQDAQQLQRALARRGGVTTAEMLSKAAAAAKAAQE